MNYVATCTYGNTCVCITLAMLRISRYACSSAVTAVHIMVHCFQPFILITQVSYMYVIMKSYVCIWLAISYEVVINN